MTENTNAMRELVDEIDRFANDVLNEDGDAPTLFQIGEGLHDLAKRFRATIAERDARVDGDAARLWREAFVEQMASNCRHIDGMATEAARIHAEWRAAELEAQYAARAAGTETDR